MRSVVVGALVVAVGCSTHYQPRRPGRVAMVMRTGSPAYVRDGVEYRHGLFGSGLIDAVRGNAAAEDAARTYRSNLVTGMLGLLGGMTCTIVASARLGQHAEDDRATASDGWLLLGCAAAMIVGGGLMISAEPYRWDAMNIFNDAEPMTWPPPQPAWSAPPVSLRMRER